MNRVAAALLLLGACAFLYGCYLLDPAVAWVMGGIVAVATGALCLDAGQRK